MAIKEPWVYLLAYNLVRLLIAPAAWISNQIPYQLRFKLAVRVWTVWQQRWGGAQAAVTLHALLTLFAEPRVGVYVPAGSNHAQ